MPIQQNLLGSNKMFSLDSMGLGNQQLQFKNLASLLSSSQQSFPNIFQSIQNSALFSKDKNLEFENLMETDKPVICQDKIEIEQENIQCDAAKLLTEFECKKEVVSKTDTRDDTIMNQEKKDNLGRYDNSKEQNIHLSSVNSIQMENLRNFKLQRMENDGQFKSTIETAALDTIKTALNAQLLLGEAIKKATLLNNLMNMQVNYQKA